MCHERARHRIVLRDARSAAHSARSVGSSGLTLPRTAQSLGNRMASHVRAPARLEVGDDVRDLLRPHLPLRWRDGDLSDRLALGTGGLGLDSIRLLEVVLACEDRFGVTLAVEELETSVPTLGDLVGLVEAALGRVS